MIKEIYHKENPFLSEVGSVILPVTKRKRIKAVIIDSASGQLLSDDNGVALLTTKESSYEGYNDVQPYVKLYTDKVDFMRKLSTSGIFIFSYMVQHVNAKQCSIMIEPAVLCKELGLKSERSIYGGINDLIENNVIARAYSGKKSGSLYWINPTIFFNGNREILLKK